MIFDAFVRRLRGSVAWRKEQEHVARLVVERPQDTIAFAGVLDLELERRGFDPAVHAVRSSLLDLVCGLVHDDATQLAVRLASRPAMTPPGTGGRQLHRARGAMQIAGTRPAPEIWELLGDRDGLRHSDPEFGLLLLHEVVVRGEPAPPPARWFVEWAAGTGHPLGQLPPALLPIEDGFPDRLPRYGRAVGAAPADPPAPAPAEPSPLGAIVPGVGQAVKVDTVRIGAPFRHWAHHATGRVQITAFAAAGSGFPPSLPPPRLAAEVRSSTIPAAAGVESLFAAAVARDASSLSPGGAEARRRTWEAVSGIVDRAWPAPLPAVAAAATAARWVEAEPDDPWFGAGAGHLWLLVEAADRLVVVAASETG